MLGLYWFVRPFQRCNENMSGMPASSPTRYLRGEAVQQSSCKWSPGVKTHQVNFEIPFAWLEAMWGNESIIPPNGKLGKSSTQKCFWNGWGNVMWSFPGGYVFQFSCSWSCHCQGCLSCPIPFVNPLDWLPMCLSKRCTGSHYLTT